MIKFKK